MKDNQDLLNEALMRQAGDIQENTDFIIGFAKMLSGQKKYHLQYRKTSWAVAWVMEQLIPITSLEEYKWYREQNALVITLIQVDGVYIPDKDGYRYRMILRIDNGRDVLCHTYLNADCLPSGKYTYWTIEIDIAYKDDVEASYFVPGNWMKPLFDCLAKNETSINESQEEILERKIRTINNRLGIGTVNQ